MIVIFNFTDRRYNVSWAQLSSTYQHAHTCMYKHAAYYAGLVYFISDRQLTVKTGPLENSPSTVSYQKCGALPA